MDRVASVAPNFSVENLVDEHIKDRREQLKELAEKSGASSLDAETTVRIGVPVRGTTEGNRRKKILDLLVMGTKGRSNLVDMIMGSCAQKMFRRCPIPLLSLREAQFPGVDEEDPRLSNTVSI